jgi:hypothetical protein
VRRVAPWVAALALILVYPAYVLATDGGPRFPNRDECVRPATADGDIDAVFGYFDSERDAVVMRDNALGVGFVGTEMAWNGCGRVRVAVGGIPTLEVGREFVEQARGAGFDVTLEQAAPS